MSHNKPTQEEDCGLCNDFKQWDPLSKPKTKASTDNKKVKNETSKLSDLAPDASELGRSTWTFLHTMAAYYPENPSVEKQQQTKVLLESFSHLYPCSYCASHMREQLKVSPPDVSNQKQFSKWMCDLHNEVNERLGKDIFDCSKVDERWKANRYPENSI